MNDLNDRLTPKAKSEFESLLKLKAKLAEEGLEENDGKLYSYDWRYLQSLQQEREFDLDQDVVKKYFPMKHVQAEMFKLYQSLFDVKFTEIKEGEAQFLQVRGVQLGVELHRHLSLP